jgi:S1-C subfamily serine protease
METNMKLQPHYRIWIAITVLIMSILACIGPTPVQPVAPTPASPEQPTPVSPNSTPSSNDQTSRSRADLISATVQIYGLQKKDGKLTPIYSGSGTIISSTGLILTNAHVASPAARGEPEAEPDALAVALMDQEDKPPVFLYFAKVKAVDGYMDLAVIQLTTTLDGTSVDPNSLNLPYVELGNSDGLHVGDHINVFGFPGIGGDTITFTDGSVSGFTAQEGLGDRAWIKTNAGIAGGNSGGLASNDAGFIIGVPTIASAGAAGDITDCRVIQDTNGDGIVDKNDTCIPIGEFINGLRPINLALPLIKAAQSGLAYASPFDQSNQSSSQGSGSETFSSITWYSATGGSDCKVKDPVNSFPSGTSAMAGVFNFSGMTDGEPWAEKWLVDGQELYSTTDKPAQWGSGSDGKTYTCLFSSQSGMPEGNYHVELYAGTNLQLMTQSDVVVGGGSGPGPNPQPDQGVVTVYGQIVDGGTLNPLPGAQVFVLVPGKTFAQWKTDNFADADIFTSAKADNQGNYTMPDKLALNVEYTFIVFMKDYKITYGDGLVWTDKDPVNYPMNVNLTK